MAWRKLVSFLRNGVGATGLLWIPTLFLLHEAFAPSPPGGVLALVFALGALLQGGLYLLANRGFFLGARPPAQLAAAGGALALVAAGLAAGMPLAWHVASAGTALEIRPDALVLAAAQLLVLEYRVFTRRVSFRAMVEFADAAKARARAVTRVLLPVGTFHLDRVVTRLEEASARADAGAVIEPGPELRDLAQELRLRWDDRFARFVPWATASSLVAAFLELIAQRHGSRLAVRCLERGEDVDRVPVRGATVCALVEAVASRLPEGGKLEVASSAGGGGLRLTLRASGGAGSMLLPAPILGELRETLRSGVRISREATSGGWQLELWYPPARPGAAVEPDPARLGAPDLQVLEGGESLDEPKRVYRRGDEVVKVHFAGAFDTKPTLLEDEFYIMRRLSGQGPWFPQVTGTGRQAGYYWLSYRFEPGTPVDVWLADAAHRPHWLRILLDVQQIVRRLTDLGVAHRDLNPGNFIVRPDGSLVLIDFDQAVADAPAYRGADLDGAARGDAKNDLRSFLEQAGLTRLANDAVRCLSRAWPAEGAAFELELAAHLFPGRQPWDQLWYPILEELGPLAGRRVLDWESALPLFGLVAASHEADVTIRPADALGAELARELGGPIGGRLRLVDDPDSGPGEGHYDVAVCLHAEGVPGRLDRLPLEQVSTLVTTWPGDGDELAARLARAGLGAPRTIAFTSRLVPVVLALREE